MDLALDLIKGSGRAKRPVTGEIVRELTEADVVLLQNEQGIKPPLLKKLRDSHHSIARFVAQGMTGAQISQITGYSQSRISILKADPAFAELVAFYRERVEDLRDEVQTDLHTKMYALAIDYAELIHDRVLDAPEIVSLDTAGDHFFKLTDRLGHGPLHKSTSLNVNLSDNASRVAAGRQRAGRVSAEEPPPSAPGQLIPSPTDRAGGKE